MKKLFIIFLLFITHYSLIIGYAQPVTQEWVRRYTDTSSSYWGGMSVKSDSLGFIYVLTGGDFGFGFLKYNSSGTLLTVASYNPNGYSNSSKAFDVTSVGDVYITGRSNANFIDYMSTVKFNSNGALQWAKLFKPDNDDAPSDLKVDKAGNIIVVGGSLVGSSNFALTVKYNSNGDTLWTRHFNNGQNDAATEKVVLDNSNNIYVTGYVALNCFTLKYNPTGNLDWFTPFTISPSNSNIGQSIALDLFGNIYVIGTSSVPFSGLNNYLLKLSNGGVILWNRVFTGIINGQGRCEFPMSGPVISTEGGSVYYTTDCVNGTGGGGYSIATLKYNSAGDSEWVKVFNGGGIAATANGPASIKLDRYNNIYICGSGYYQATGDDFVTIRYSPAGIQQWVATYSGEITNGGDYAQALFIDTNLSVYVTGDSPNLHGGRDAVTIKYNQPVGINNNHNELPLSFSLSQNFPNPFNPTTVITYSLPRKSNIVLSVYNITGQLVKELVKSDQNIGYYSIAFNAEDLASGAYFYCLLANNILIDTKKFILIK